MGKISEIMREANRYFPRTYENLSLVFAATGKTITGVFAETYIAGQYIYIQHSVLNDGVYTIVTASSTVITVAETLRSETNKVNFYGLQPPRDFIDLVAEIDAYTSKDGVSSEKIDDYSVTFEKEGGWKTAFKARINTYRRFNPDLGELIYANNKLLLKY